MGFQLEILVGIGGNLPFAGGSPLDTLHAGIGALRRAVGGLQRPSRIYRSPAFPAGSGPDFVNAAVAISQTSDVTAAGLLAQLHEIEAEFGRERVQRWGGRTLDLDLLAFGDQVLPDSGAQTHWRAVPPARQRTDAPDQLILPHPRLQDRAFVLVPLADVAPNWRHPIIGMTVSQMLATLPQSERDAVTAL